MIGVPAVVAIGVGTSVVGAGLVELVKYVRRKVKPATSKAPSAKSAPVAAGKWSHINLSDILNDEQKADLIAQELRRKDLTPEQRERWLAKTAENPYFSPGGKYGALEMGGVDTIAERLERLRKAAE